MGRPVWVTKAGDLGVIAERQFYNLRFDVIDPDDGALTYSIVGGNLPAGLSIKDDGFIEGIPTVRKVFVRGVPTDVAEDVISTFAVRCQTETGDVADRTFTLTVSGQDIPTITTTVDSLGTYFDGTYFEYQLVAVDLDSDILTWEISNGVLPNGLSLDSATGIISGFIDIAVDELYGASGWYNTDWDQTPWDFGSQSVNKNFQFTVSVTDQKDFALRTYTIYILSKDGMTADNSIITADNSSIVTADTDNKRTPVLLTPAQDLGVILHDNYFAYKFEGKDFDGDNILYQLVNGSAPGLTLDDETGWYYGYIPSQALLEQEYSIDIRVVKRDSPTVHLSDLYNFTFTIIGDLGKFVQWVTDSDLGSIANGDVSEFFVEASNGLGRTLYYRLADDYGTGAAAPTEYNFVGDGSTTDFVVGTTINPVEYTTVVTVDGEELTQDVDWSWLYNNTAADQQFYIEFTTAPDNLAVIVVTVDDGIVSSVGTSNSAGKLPQGLRLEPNGLITGRASFNGFTIDGGATTFDVIFRRTSSVETPTTFDTVNTFTVEVYDGFGDISTYKTFSILVNLANAVPYDNLYAQALLPKSDRDSLNAILANPAIIDPDNVYRVGDPYFDIAKDIRLLVASGVYPATSDEFQAAIANNHFNKRVQLGEIKTARALDSAGNVKYEVVYAVVSDNKITADGVSSSRSLQLGNVSISGGFDPVIYPNSFENMRAEVYENLTQSNQDVLPDWMSSKQSDGKVLGLINAAVLCYTKPGLSDQVAFNIRRSGVNLSDFDIILDRYIWDNNLTDNYNTETDSFTASAETTFDKYSATQAALPLVATVDFAVSKPFSEINGRTLSYVLENGGFDGVTSTNVVNKTLVFAKQENYAIDTELAWQKFTSKFDEDVFDSNDFDQSETVPGYFDITNERSAVYKITFDTSGIIVLVLQSIVDTNERIDVSIGGITYGGKNLFYDPSVKSGNTVPDYSILAEESLTDQTTFDANGTKFFALKDLYAGPDDNDTYIKWPQVGVFE